jgi:hypothetical protein
MTYNISKEEFGNLTIRFRQGANIKTLVQDINIVWHEFISDPITLEYLDQNVAAHSAEDRRQGVIVTSLAALTAAEWSREVSIR